MHPAGSCRVAKLFQPSFRHLFAFCLYPSDERRHEQGSQPAHHPPYETLRRQEHSDRCPSEDAAGIY
ncbi:hypothetical protein Naga_100745g1 [Nannochloropsis gaditana]|uniref:Uncharacterized protein n=1 Tax=Nannochloropsis gaditana TaxID=72520 RepID=W7TNM3_9STRA|nr:hypothetical protein Naga_100745g1 [Nannochloropsis gaditana]